MDNRFRLYPRSVTRNYIIDKMHAIPNTINYKIS